MAHISQCERDREEMREELARQDAAREDMHRENQSRLSRVERSVYIAMGIGAALVALESHLNFVSLKWVP
jgi:hypothetical protein